MILNKDFKTRSLKLFKKLGWNPIDKICIANRLNLFKKITENKAPDYLINKLAKFKSETNYNLRSTLANRLPKPRTNSLKRTFFYGSLKTLMDLETKLNLNSRSLRKDFYKFIISQYNPDTFKVDTVF